MCGIAGFIGVGDGADLAAMTAALTHRGPDGEGSYIDAANRVHLGHRRLAILDIDGGKQPMWNLEETIGVVFNGEIYNHRELRQALEERGHIFVTDHSDTEILVHGYAEWGAAMPLRLNGMFAFAIYDRRRRRLFLARDRFGEKPLFYYAAPGLFAFASELSALPRHRSISPALDPHALQKYFAFGYVPAPSALYQRTAKLPGGHCLTLDLASERIETRCYWKFRLEPDESLQDGDEDRLAEELRHLLAQAAARRLMSDVPLGLFLSGGIDSAAVLAAIARHRSPASVETFTVGFSEPSFDESARARETAALFGTRHVEERLDLDTAASLVGEVLARLDEPLGDPSIVPTFLLCRFARRRVTVALSGDGGDELFAGYDPFRALAPARLYRRMTRAPLHRGFRRLAELFPRSAHNMSFDFKLRRALTGLSYPPSLWNPVWMGPVEPAALTEFFEEPVHIDDIYGDAMALWEEDRGKSDIERTLEFYTNFYLPDDILAKVDRAAMMNSLESRAVFLDNDLVRFCQRLPARFKYRRGTRKYLLKRALAPVLPQQILSRPKKGFGMPVGAWLRAQPMPRVDGIAAMRVAPIAAAWRDHRAGARDHRLLLWAWLALERHVARQDPHALAAA